MFAFQESRHARRAAATDGRPGEVLREADHHQGRQCSHHARTALMPISREATIRSFVRHGMPRAVAEEAVDEIDDYERSGRFLPPSAPGEKATA